MRSDRRLLAGETGRPHCAGSPRRGPRGEGFFVALPFLFPGLLGMEKKDQPGLDFGGARACRERFQTRASTTPRQIISAITVERARGSLVARMGTPKLEPIVSRSLRSAPRGRLAAETQWQMREEGVVSRCGHPSPLARRCHSPNTSASPICSLKVTGRASRYHAIIFTRITALESEK